MRCVRRDEVCESLTSPETQSTPVRRVPLPHRFVRACLLVVAAAGALAPAASAQTPGLVVSVASSLVDVMQEAARQWVAAGNTPMALNAAGSQTLARQIIEGAQVDVFISADTAQMDQVTRAGRLAPGSRVDLLTNALVVVVPADSARRVTRAADLAAPDLRRLAMGQPESVPAGVYARQWLERAGVWAQVAPRAVPLPSVRAALSAAREGRVDAAIVYATDVRTESGVRLAWRVPAAEAPPVVYVAGAMRGPRTAEAVRLLAFLQSPAMRAVFDAAGFGRPGR